MKLKDQIKKLDESLDEYSEESPNSENLFAGVKQLQHEIRDKDKIIESLKNESIELTKKVSRVEEEKSTILEELAQSRWLESKAVVATKKVYEDKVKSVINVNADSKIIPILTTVARRKQGNQQLNWVNWLKIPENRYLYEVNESIAKTVYSAVNDEIGKRLYKRPRGSGVLPDKFNNYSLTFDGVATYVTTDFNPDTYSLNEGFTVSYWVRPDEIAATRHALGRRAGSSDERFFFGIHNTRISIGVGSNATNDAAITHTMEVGNWYHWVITYQGHSSGRARKIYMNGELLYTGTVAWGTTGNTDGGENVYFGGRNNNGNFVKAWAIGLDEVAIFDEEKDADWVSSTYNGRTPTDLQYESGIVGYWRFEEGTGTTIKDLSGNGNHGTLTSTDESTYGLPDWSKETP